MSKPQNKHFRRSVLKRHFINLVAMLCLSIFIAACASSNLPTQTPDPNSTLTRIRMGVITDLPPFATYDPVKKEASGFDVELLKTIATKADIYVEFVSIYTGYNPLLSQVSQCQLAGGISAIPVMDNSTNQMAFSEPYFSSGQVLVVKKGNIKISGLDTLAGMTVGTQVNTLSALELEKMQGIQPRLFDSFYLAFQELINGNIDAVIADHPRAWNYAKVKPNNLKIIGKEFAEVSYAIAFCKDQSETLAKVNTALASMKKDGSLDKLIKKWQLTTYGQ
jgi:polar amino acid transport system substrate-binding protein